MKLLAQELIGDLAVVVVAVTIGAILNPNFTAPPPEVQIMQHTTIEQP
jgi:hypothetical protein